CYHSSTPKSFGLYVRQRQLRSTLFPYTTLFRSKEKDIEGEYKMFVDRHSNAFLLPIASTGGATKIIYDTVFPEELKNERFVKDYGYMSLFQKFLMDRI